MLDAYVETWLPYVRVEIYDGDTKIYETLVKPDEVNNVLNKYNARVI